MTTLEYDSARIWHPYAALGRAPVLHAKSASGLEIELAKHQSITIADLLTADASIEGVQILGAVICTGRIHRSRHGCVSGLKMMLRRVGKRFPIKPQYAHRKQ